MEDSRPEEKRAIRRFALQLPVTVTAKSGERLEATAESRDVSSHGICFYCDTALEAESPIEFILTLPAEITMTEPLQVRCSGTVVRVDGRSGEGKFAVAAAISNYEFVADNEMQDQNAGTEADATPAV
jgi:PilZ domain-containing protein